jgi:integrase
VPRKPKLPEHVSRFVDRHGKERYRYRHQGHSAYLKGAPGSVEFDESLEAARNREPQERFALGTVDHVLSRFYRSTSFQQAGASRQGRVRGILERFRAEYGSFKVTDFEFDIIEEILLQESVKRREGKRTVGGKVAAYNLHKQLKRFFDHAIKLKLISVNPARLADGVKQEKGGFHTWNEEEIAQYRKRHRLGTKARLYAEIILWTWQRRGDAHRFGPQHMKGERIQYTQAKGGKVLWLPAAPQLTAAIRAMPAIGMTTFLVTEFGKPFSKDGIGNKMREWCDQAGLPHCSAHGLRKAAARRAADCQGTNQQLKAAGGWSQDQEVSTYTAAADQAELASVIITRVSEWELRRDIPRTDGELV